LRLGPDGLIYITCENSAVVAVINRTTHTVIDVIDPMLSRFWLPPEYTHLGLGVKIFSKEMKVDSPLS
jgi:hypothetical protein